MNVGIEFGPLTLLLTIYIRNGKIFIPSQFKTVAGFYISGDPVYLADLYDREGISRAVFDALSQNCPVVPTPPINRLEKWAVLRHAGVSSVAAFEKGASCWIIQKNDVSFIFGPVRKISPRGWEVEPETPVIMSNNLPLDTIASEIANKIHSTKVVM